jgi:uncharacterized protein (DUF305 family)
MKIHTIVLPVLLALAPVLAIAQGHSAAQMAFMEAHQKMTKEMSKPMTGDADKDFAMMMIPHHQGAIDMAKVELQHGKDPKLRAMAETIIKAQEKEIAELKAWQAARR